MSINFWPHVGPVEAAAYQLVDLLRADGVDKVDGELDQEHHQQERSHSEADFTLSASASWYHGGRLREQVRASNHRV